MDLEQFEQRKRSHIELSLDASNQATSELDRYRLRHDALPGVDWSELDLTPPPTRLGGALRVPFYVAGMTAGHPDAADLNLRLARAAERRGWAMGVGSQRRQLTDAQAASEWVRLRSQAPSLYLIGNLGIAQVRLASAADVKRLVESIGAQAFAIHCNALQEALQPEGTPEFAGDLEAIERVCETLGARTPVILKETGCGWSHATLRRVARTPVAGVDVSGLGGTHWGRIEGARARAQAQAAALGASGERAAWIRAQAAVTFADWGIPTAESLSAARETLGARALLASGGVRSGLDAARLLALGAHWVGYAQPALAAALAGEEALDRWMELQEFELRTALFCTGSRGVAELRERGVDLLDRPPSSPVGVSEGTES